MGVKIIKFCNKNKSITVMLSVALIIIFSYLITMEMPELFNNAERWFNLSFQLSVGYTINFIFYVTQVYIANIKRNEEVYKCIKKRIDVICRHMEAPIRELYNIYFTSKYKEENFDDKDLAVIKNALNFDDEVKHNNYQKKRNYYVREWIQYNLTKTEDEIDRLYRHYSPHISERLMVVLEGILTCEYHGKMKFACSFRNNKIDTQTDMAFINVYCDLKRSLEEVCRE